MNIKPPCHYCGGKDVRKHGFARSGLRRYLCNNCNKTFQKRYIYNMDKEVSQQLMKVA